MDSEEKEKAFLDLVRSNFDFLFSRGFKITSVVSQTRHIIWVILEAECSIMIGGDAEGEGYITLAKRGTPVENWKDWYTLETVIYFLSKKTYYIKACFGGTNEQIQRFGKPLQDYLDEIVALFTDRNFDEIGSEIKKLLPVIDELINEEYVAYKSKSSPNAE